MIPLKGGALAFIIALALAGNPRDVGAFLMPGPYGGALTYTRARVEAEVLSTLRRERSLSRPRVGRLSRERVRRRSTYLKAGRGSGQKLGEELLREAKRILKPEEVENSKEEDEPEETQIIPDEPGVPTVVVPESDVEIRFPVLYVSVCLDREETEEEEKNEVFWNHRLLNSHEHLKWARITQREENPTAMVMFDRTILSPSKHKIIGNIIGIRAKNKKEAEAVLDRDPFVAAGLFKTRSLYRWPSLPKHHKMFYPARYLPYVALCMDKRGMSEVRKATRPAHIEYLTETRNATEVGPLFPPKDIVVRVKNDDPDMDDDEEEEKKEDEPTPVGSMIFFSAACDEDAAAYVEKDPYSKAGLFKNVFVTRYNDLDVEGRFNFRPLEEDLMRDELVEMGYGEESDYLPRLEKKTLAGINAYTEVIFEGEDDDTIKMRKQAYMKRDARIRLAQNGTTTVRDTTYMPGTYVYIGNETENEWYDYYPSRTPLLTEETDFEAELKEAEFPAFDIYEDDL